jgi:hypothetical protein
MSALEIGLALLIVACAIFAIAVLVDTSRRSRGRRDTRTCATKEAPSGDYAAPGTGALGDAGRRGSTTVNAVPRPTALCSFSSPPCCSTAAS